MLMAMMGILPMVASLAGLTSAWAGFGIHMVISVLVGLARPDRTLRRSP